MNEIGVLMENTHTHKLSQYRIIAAMPCNGENGS